MIVKTLASACPLLEVRWQKGRQADKCAHSLPTFLAAPSNFLSLPSTQFLKNGLPSTPGFLQAADFGVAGVLLT
jgi:hypothetical protein